MGDFDSPEAFIAKWEKMMKGVGPGKGKTEQQRKEFNAKKDGMTRQVKETLSQDEDRRTQDQLNSLFKDLTGRKYTEQGSESQKTKSVDVEGVAKLVNPTDAPEIFKYIQNRDPIAVDRIASKPGFDFKQTATVEYATGKQSGGGKKIDVANWNNSESKKVFNSLVFDTDQDCSGIHIANSIDQGLIITSDSCNKNDVEFIEYRDPYQRVDVIKDTKKVEYTENNPQKDVVTYNTKTPIPNALKIYILENPEDLEEDQRVFVYEKGDFEDSSKEVKIDKRYTDIFVDKIYDTQRVNMVGSSSYLGIKGLPQDKPAQPADQDKEKKTILKEVKKSIFHVTLPGTLDPTPATGTTGTTGTATAPATGTAPATTPATGTAPATTPTAAPATGTATAPTAAPATGTATAPATGTAPATAPATGTATAPATGTAPTAATSSAAAATSQNIPSWDQYKTDYNLGNQVVLNNNIYEYISTTGTNPRPGNKTGKQDWRFVRRKSGGKRDEPISGAAVVIPFDGDKLALVGLLTGDKDGNGYYRGLTSSQFNYKPGIVKYQKATGKLVIVKETKEQKREEDLSKKQLTPLQFAVLNGDTESVRVLIQMGADFNIPTPKGETLLQLVGYRKQNDVYKNEIIQLLRDVQAAQNQARIDFRDFKPLNDTYGKDSKLNFGVVNAVYKRKYIEVQTGKVSTKGSVSKEIENIEKEAKNDAKAGIRGEKYIKKDGEFKEVNEELAKAYNIAYDLERAKLRAESYSERNEKPLFEPEPLDDVSEYSDKEERRKAFNKGYSSLEDRGYKDGIIGKPKSQKYSASALGLDPELSKIIGLTVSTVEESKLYDDGYDRGVKDFISKIDDPGKTLIKQATINGKADGYANTKFSRRGEIEVDDPKNPGKKIKYTFAYDNLNTSFVYGSSDLKTLKEKLAKIESEEKTREQNREARTERLNQLRREITSLSSNQTEQQQPVTPIQTQLKEKQKEEKELYEKGVSENREYVSAKKEIEKLKEQIGKKQQKQNRSTREEDELSYLRYKLTDKNAEQRTREQNRERRTLRLQELKTEIDTLSKQQPVAPIQTQLKEKQKEEKELYEKGVSENRKTVSARKEIEKLKQQIEKREQLEKTKQLERTNRFKELYGSETISDTSGIEVKEEEERYPFNEVYQAYIDGFKEGRQNKLSESTRGGKTYRKKKNTKKTKSRTYKKKLAKK